MPHKADTADAILTRDEPRCILIHLLYDVSSERLKKVLIRGIVKNTSEDELKCLQPQIKQFLRYFSRFETKRGDEIALDYLPDRGTRIRINGREKGVVPGSEFNRALLRIWLGNKPADDDLKAGLLGRKNL
ncbi:MAG: chalcone isomerase family protein [Deltaproteobacteria bacterium]|nr:chalcone isomerase family protein [Deltaproteobacteria bacterium]MDL1960989.1 chalcone isomerase family protein [Deltaproteobacteria bacterium]